MTPRMKTKPRAGAWLRRSLFALSLAATGLCGADALALSALQDLPGSPAADQQKPAAEPPATGLPAPDPLVNAPAADTEGAPAPLPLNGGKPADAIYDINSVPEPVKKTRQLIVEAAASGNIEQLRPLLGTGAKATDVSVGETAGDPVNTLKELAGDPDGIEILSSILNIMGSGFAHVSVGTPDEAYVWPYFAAKPLKSLTLPEKVELMRIVTAGDYQDMQDFGTYSFYRIGIAPDGTWKFFRSGE